MGLHPRRVKLDARHLETHPVAVLSLEFSAMRAVHTTNNLTELSFVEAMFRAEGIDFVVFDAQVSAAEGAIGAFPRRVMVADADTGRALALLAELERDRGAG
jgi:NADH:ubiquinone oxidoreductase subunit K